MLDRSPKFRNLADVLSFLHERFSAMARNEESMSEFRRGYRAGMTFARVCVLDELTVETLRADAAFGDGATASDRRRAFDAVQGLEDRIRDETRWVADAEDRDFHLGYQAALQIAGDYVEFARTALGADRPPVGAHRPVRSRSRRAAALAGAPVPR